MSGTNVLDPAAREVWVDWPGEKCGTCSRDLPRRELRCVGKVLAVGGAQYAWMNEDIEGVFCRACYWRWYYGEYGAVSEIIEELPDNDLATAVIRALIRKGGVLSVTETEHLARTLGTLEATEYESTIVWKRRRDQFIESRQKPLRCELCATSVEWTGTKHRPIRPEVHHLTYERKTAELDSDLALLCDRCHTLIHKPHLERSHAHFRKLLRDFDEKRLLEVIYGLLPVWGWGHLKAAA